MLEHILVPLDGSSLAECVLPHVVALARPFDAQVTLLRVVSGSPQDGGAQTVDPLDWQMRKAEAKAYLDEVAERLADLDLQTERVILDGKAAERIVEHARGAKVDLIVLSSHGRSGLSEWNINSVVQKVILQAYIPTLIVRAYRAVDEELTEMSYERLLVPLDGSQRAECVLPMARTVADYHDCRLLIAHVVPKPEVPRRAPLTEEEGELADRLTELNRQHGADYLEDVKGRLSPGVETRLLVSDNAAAALHELVSEEEIDMVLLSAHGYSGEAQWPYGSVALNFIAYGTIPLLIVQDISKAEIGTTPAEEAASEAKGH